jgi:hypothetical protein
MRVEGVEHAVAGGVFDLAKIDLGASESLLKEREDLAKTRTYVPGPEDIVDAEFALLGVDADADSGGSFLVEHDDLGDLALDLVEGGEEHFLGFDSAGVDIAFVNGFQDLVDHLELSEVVGSGLSRAWRGGDGEPQPVPKAASVHTGGEENREA